MNVVIKLCLWSSQIESDSAEGIHTAAGNIRLGMDHFTGEAKENTENSIFSVTRTV